MMEHYSFYDQDIACNEGWFIAECEGSENGPFQLQRVDEYMLFASDDEAWLYVYTQAMQGSSYHQQALDFLDENNEQEYKELVKYCRERVSYAS